MAIRSNASERAAHARSRAPVRRRLLASLLAAALALDGMALAPPAIATEAARRDDAAFIVTKPPKAGSRARDILVRAAGSPRIETLDMSKSEAWMVPAGRAGSFTRAARKLGVKIQSEMASAKPMMVMPMRARMKMSAEQSRMMSMAMSSPAAMSVTMARTAEPGAMEFLLTRGMNAPEDAQSPPVIELGIDAARTLRLRRTRIERTTDGWTWHGVVEGTDQPATLLWWPSGKLSGSITHLDRMYAVRDMGGGAHALVEIDPNRMPMEHAPSEAMRVRGGDVMSDPLVRTGEAVMMRPDAMQKRPEGKAPEMVAATGDVTIDVLVAYTRAAKTQYTDIERDLVALAVEEANQSFRNSNVGHVRLRLVHAYETAYTEAGGHFDHLWRFADRGDGLMEEVHRLRDEHKADVALLIVDDRVGCGLATRVAAEADEAFAVVHHACAATSYTVAHEVGHIIGARHDRALDQNSHPFEFGHGYVHGTEWRTMMSYKQSCDDCPRLPFWSSPRVRIRGVPAGSDKHDNAKAIALGAARVAGFR